MYTLCIPVAYLLRRVAQKLGRAVSKRRKRRRRRRRAVAKGQ